MFRIPSSEVRHRVPKGLTLDVDGDGFATIELGYVQFIAGAGYPDMPATEELAWGVAVQRERGFGMAFVAMNIGADEPLFLERNKQLGFKIEAQPLRFETVFDPSRTFLVNDRNGAPICELRTSDEGGLVLPWLPGTTEVWTEPDGEPLARREFMLRGPARLHWQPKIASRLFDHSFFGDVRVSRAEPLAYRAFTSLPESRRPAPGNAQWFSEPKPWRR